MNPSDFLLSAALGLALAACSGLRVFVPLLAASIAYRTGYLPPSPGFAWLSSWPALAVLATATVVELVGYYVPVVDNFLDTLTTPAASIAGTLLMASSLPEMSPVLRWGLGILVGGGAAGLVQTGTAVLRAGSTATTGGLGNPLFATLENILAVVGAAFGLLLPLIMAGLVVLAFVVVSTLLARQFWRWWTRGRQRVSGADPNPGGPNSV